MRLGKDRGAWLFGLSSLLVAASFLLFESSKEPWAAQRIENVIRVRLAGQPAEIRLDAKAIHVSGMPQSNANNETLASLRLRSQSKGLLLLPATGPPIVVDRETLFITWQGRAQLSYELDEERTVERVEIGMLLVQKWQDDLRLVLHCDLEIYLSGVIEAEIGGASPIEALKAQAVAARSYALSCKRRSNERIFDLYDDTRSQTYRGIHDGMRVRKAIEATRTLVLRYQEKIVRAYFSSTCGGRTRDGKNYFKDVPGPPFRSVPCTACTKSSMFRWTRRKGPEQVRQLEPGDGALYIDATLKSERGDWIRARLRRAGKKARSLAFKEIKRTLQLPSTWVTGIKSDSLGGLVITGRGFGHGVGLCQHGARGYAKQGQDYRQILLHYFPGSTIDRAHE